MLLYNIYLYDKYILYSRKSKYICSNYGALTRWRHQLNKSLHNPITYGSKQCTFMYTGSVQRPYSAVQDPGHHISIMEVMKLGQNAPRVGFELTSIAFQAIVLTITPHRLLDVITLHTHLSMWFLAWEVSVDYYPCLPGTISLLILTITYIQAMVLHRVGSTTIQRIACTGSWSQQPVSWVWWKWKILCLEQDSNAHLWHSWPVC